MSGPPRQQSPQFYKFSVFFVFVENYNIWSSGQDLVTRLYLKIPKKRFVRLILKKRFWVVVDIIINFIIY